MKRYLGELRWLFGKARPFLGRVVCLSLGGASLSLLGVLFVYLLKELIDGASAANLKLVGVFSVLLGISILLRLVFQAVYSFSHTKTMEMVKNYFREDLVGRGMRADWQELAGYHSGDILMRATTDIDVLARGLVGMFPSLVGLGVQFVGALVVVYLLDRGMAFIILLAGPFLWLLLKVFGQKLRRMFTVSRELEGRVRSFVQEVVQNIQAIKTFNLEEHMAGRLAELQKKHLTWVLKKTILSLITGICMSVCYWLAYFLVLVWGLYRLAGGLLTVGSLVAFLQLVGQVQGPFQGLVGTVPKLISVSASVGRLREIEGLSQDDLPEGRDISVVTPTGLCLSRLSFSYVPGVDVLHGIDLAIAPGEMVAIVGASGAGKTTLLKILLALLAPSGGTAFVSQEGKHLALGAETRWVFTYVPQENVLFTGTVRDNIRLGNLAASEPEIVACLQAAAAWDFISRLPQGMDTELGEKGLGLSLGQAQRLAIARALLRDAPILLLDEATSALDEETEGEVLQAIKSRRPLCTCIFVTHRASVAACCDSVYKIRQGCLAPMSIITREGVQ